MQTQQKEEKNERATGCACILIWAVAAILAALFMGSREGHAADLLRLNVTGSSGPVQEGTLKDGMHLGLGTLSTPDSHNGFRVWSPAPLSGTRPGHYVLTGTQDARHALRVRLEREGWQPAVPGAYGNSNGVLTLTPGSLAALDVVVDGDQQVAPDQYPLELRANLMTPDASRADIPAAVQSLDIPVVKAVTLTHTLTAAKASFTPLLADNTVLANGKVTTVGGGRSLAVRWTPGSGEINGTRNTIPVKSGTGTVLVASLNLAGAQAQADGWYSVTGPVSTLSYTLRSAGAQTVWAGAYTVSLQAGVWVN